MGLPIAMTGLRLTDMGTGHKTFCREVSQSPRIEENQVDIETELTARVARQGWRIREVGVSFVPHSFESGKKIRLSDGLRSARCIFWHLVQ